MPHADDELIACHNYILKHRKDCSLFFCGLTGSNNGAKNKSDRKNEFLNYCKRTNVNYYISGDDVGHSFNELLQSFKPDYVFVPSYFDWHSEHRFINSVITKTLVKSHLTSTSVVWYRISVPLPPELINYSIVMSRKEHLNKWKTFREIYKTQRHLDVARFKFIERFNIDLKYASEVFFVANINKCKGMISVLDNNLEELDALKNYLDDGGLLFLKMIDVYNRFKGEFKNETL